MLKLQHIITEAVAIKSQPIWLERLAGHIKDIRFRNPVTCEVFVHLAKLIDKGVFNSATDTPADEAQIRDIFEPTLLKYIEKENKKQSKRQVDAQSVVDELVQSLLFQVQS